MQHLRMITSNASPLEAELVGCTGRQICSSSEVLLPFGIALRGVEITLSTILFEVVCRVFFLLPFKKGSRGRIAMS